MAAQTAEAEIDALLDVLGTLADEIVVEQAALDDRFARRLAIFRRLTELQVKQAVIAEAAKVTPMAVSYALGADRRRSARQDPPAKATTRRAGRKASR